jgi:hypothetical protein
LAKMQWFPGVGAMIYISICALLWSNFLWFLRPVIGL